MKYTFPIINHIDEVREAIRGRSEFVEKEGEGYTVINYIVQLEDTFPNGEHDRLSLIRRECRGIVFGKDGSVISRPFHKFFNMGEKSETNSLYADCSWQAMEKLDGSMIRPIPIENGYRLGSKMGVTGVALAAEIFVAQNPEYDAFIRAMIAQNLTPIFEWCSQSNRIVVLYPSDRLVLTAIRHNVTGEYVRVDVPVAIDEARVYPMTTIEEVREYLETNDEGFEGFVLRSPEGHMLKAKGDWYLQLHKVKDQIRFEKDVIKIFTEDRFDDLKPMLLDADLKRLTAFHTAFFTGIEETGANLYQKIVSAKAKYTVRRDYAVEFVQLEEEWFRPVLYQFFDKEVDLHSVINYIVGYIGKTGTSSSTAVEKVRSFFRCYLNEVGYE